MKLHKQQVKGKASGTPVTEINLQELEQYLFLFLPSRCANFFFLFELTTSHIAVLHIFTHRRNQ